LSTSDWNAVVTLGPPFVIPSANPLAIPTAIDCTGYTKLTIEFSDSYAASTTLMYAYMSDSDGTDGVLSTPIAIGTYGSPTTREFDLTGRSSISVGVHIGSRNNDRSWCRIKTVTLS